MNIDKLKDFYNNKFSKRNPIESFEDFYNREDRGSSKKYQKAKFYQEFLKS